MEQEKIVIELGKNKMAVLVVQPFDGDIDTDNLLKIDYSNILGEILTFPVAFNRIANLRAEIINLVAVAKMDTEIFEAQLYEKHQSKLAASSDKSRGPSIKEIESAVLQDPQYKVKRSAYLSRQKDFEYLDALYWSAKSKDTKLNVLSEKITPHEFENELVEGAINGVMIHVTKKALKG